VALQVICLDTNYLIRGLVEGSEEEAQLITWSMSGEMLVASSVAWYEFRCGPVSAAEIDTMNLFVKIILPYTELEAEVAAKLFEQAGRKRSLKTDAMIAATAIVAKAKLATNNAKDFRHFHGIHLTGT
jgi:predicted nucleic acid-binding protein